MSQHDVKSHGTKESEKRQLTDSDDKFHYVAISAVVIGLIAAIVALVKLIVTVITVGY